MNRRGFTLIDLMVGVALIGIGGLVWMNAAGHHLQASRRAMAVEGIARAIDQELERARACEAVACLEALETKTATTAGVSIDAESWVRPEVHRSIEPTSNAGLYRITVSARVPGLVRERKAVALMRVKR